MKIRQLITCQVFATAFLLIAAAIPLSANGSPFNSLTPEQQLSEDVLRELVSFESSQDHPDQVKAALQAMETRLLDAGFDAADVQVLNPSPISHGMVVRYRGVGTNRPMLLLAHIDVVVAVADAWSFPPFKLGKKDGYYFGRGTEDNKAGVVQIISNFISLKRQGWVPDRDIIAVISGDEESTGDFAKWAANEGRHLADGEFAINTDAGGGENDEDGGHRALWVQTSEKLYQAYRLTTHNKGGHSSVPRRDSAFGDMAIFITRLTDHEFPVELNATTRSALRRSSALYSEEVARDLLAVADDDFDAATIQRLTAYDPWFNAMLRTTCAPTLLTGGHAENALPREASVTVNCRIMPGTPAVEIEQVIRGMMDGIDYDLEIVWDGLASDVSEIPDALMEQIESLSEQAFGEIPVIPGMSTGATDGLFFRNAGIPVYGVSGLFANPGDSGAHGLDEKIGIRQFHDSVEFLNQLLRSIAD